MADDAARNYGVILGLTYVFMREGYKQPSKIKCKNEMTFFPSSAAAVRLQENRYRVTYSTCPPSQASDV